VREYLKDFNASAACLRAGYKTKSPSVSGCQILAHPSVQAELNSRIIRAKTANEITIDAWAAETVKIAFADMPLREATWDHKLKALDFVGRHLGAFQNDVSIAGSGLQININLGVFDTREEDRG
jgi:hypothetical protein